jgi:hypothetical protein
VRRKAIRALFWNGVGNRAGPFDCAPLTASDGRGSKPVDATALSREPRHRGGQRASPGTRMKILQSPAGGRHRCSGSTSDARRNGASQLAEPFHPAASK